MTEIEPPRQSPVPEPRLTKWIRRLCHPRRSLRTLWRRLVGPRGDYRQALFDDLRSRLNGSKQARILEIGPRDAQDTRRLLTLAPENLTLIELPQKKDQGFLHAWADLVALSNVDLILTNFMYDPQILELPPRSGGRT